MAETQKSHDDLRGIDMTHAFTEQGHLQPPAIVNEPVKTYAPGSAERASLAATLATLSSQQIELPMVIGGRTIRTGRTVPSIMPHRHAHILGQAHQGGGAEVQAAIAAAGATAYDWSRRHWSERAAVFLRAAELLAGPWRDRLNAATMLGQSKTVHQAEIDS